jgi:predicted nuclease of predicted toxin-antitoxin system
LRFLIDNALSPVLAVGLAEEGHDAVHVRDLVLAAADDEVVLQVATEQDRVLVSADTDFGTLLAVWSQRKPSVILFRRGSERRSQLQLGLRLANLPEIQPALEAGSVVVFAQDRIRIRALPIGAGPRK